RLVVQGECENAYARVARVRSVPLVDAFGAGTDWAHVDLDRDGVRFRGAAELAAGGWFRIEVQLLDDAGVVVGEGDVQPVGIGEVFVVAGQSYVLGAHETMTTVDDPLGRITAISPEE